MKRLLGPVAALALVAGLSACATATPYQPNLPGASVSGGYSEMRVEPDRWRGSFAGNSMTSRETVEGYLLYRAAELTAQQGFDGFSIVTRATDRDARTYVQPDPFYNPWYGPSYTYWRPHWRYYSAYGWRTRDPYFGDPFFADRMDVRTVERYEATAEILMYRGAKAPGDPNPFDARAVLESLGPRIVRPTP